MKRLKQFTGVFFVFMLLLTMMPVRTEAASYKTVKPDDDELNFNIGTNYQTTLKISSYEYDFYPDVDSEDGYELKSAVSSDPSVVKTTVLGADWFSVKVKKYGKATLTVKIYDSVHDKTKTSKIKITAEYSKSTIKSRNWIFKGSKKVTVNATNVRKGDTIKLVIGKKTYTKKIKKTAAKTTVKIKISKPGFYGKKYKLTLVRKGKVIAKSSKYVYLSDTVYVGYTKKQVKWLVYWNDPDKKNKTAYSEQWCYDWNYDDGFHDAYLYFDNKGKVTNWQIFDD